MEDSKFDGMLLAMAQQCDDGILQVGNGYMKYIIVFSKCERL